jgi:hypothetical protein
MMEEKGIGTAIHDPERQGILLPASELAGSPFRIGDRLVIKKGQRRMFAVELIRDDAGDVIMDKAGIFIPRSRRVDILLGGIYERFGFRWIADTPPRIIVVPEHLGLNGITPGARIESTR